MKKIIVALLVIPTVFFSGTVSAQSNSTTVETTESVAKKSYLVVRVNYVQKKSGTLSRIQVDLGSSKTHPLHNVIWNMDGVLRVSENGKNFNIENEVDLLEFLAARNWKMVSVKEVNIMNTDYIQYLFEREAL